MYGEEADFCLRAHKFGAKPMVTPDATIIHYGGASEKILADKMVKLLKAKRMLMKNHWSATNILFGKIDFSNVSVKQNAGVENSRTVQAKFQQKRRCLAELWRREKSG